MLCTVLDAIQKLNLRNGDVSTVWFVKRDRGLMSPQQQEAATQHVLRYHNLPDDRRARSARSRGSSCVTFRSRITGESFVMSELDVVGKFFLVALEHRQPDQQTNECSHKRRNNRGHLG